MIIIINGILGVGKSSTAQMLAERLVNSHYIQGDDHSEFEGFDPRNKQHIYRVLASVASEVDVLHDKSNIIVDYIFEDQEQLDYFTALLDVGQRYSHFYLYCDEIENQQRVLTRSREDIDWELKRIVELRRIMDKNWDVDSIIIDTTARSIEDVVEEVLTNL